MRVVTPDVRTWLARGFARLDAGDRAGADAGFRGAALLDPTSALAAYGVAIVAIRHELWERARSAMSWAIVAARRGDPPRLLSEACAARGLAARRQGELEAGWRDYRRAVLASPAESQLVFNLANAAADIGEPAAALTSAQRAALAGPDRADRWNNLGRLANDTERFALAGSAYRRALALAPSEAMVWNNLGILDKRRDRIGAALRCFRRALRCDPGHRDAWANLGRNALIVGDFGAGWAALERNWRSAGFRPASGAFDLPIWDGSPLAGGALLVWSEEKVGDDILFASLLHDVAALAGRVIFLCNPRLESLFRPALDGIEVVPWDGSAPAPEVVGAAVACYPLEFVGRHVRRRFDEFPRSPVPYLRRAIGDAVAGGDGPPRVGLAWYSVNSLIGRYKSQRLADWAPILSVPGIEFVSLQYGANEAEIDALERRTGLAVTIPAGVDQMADMAGFARFVAGLDLVVSIPNTTVHVSGALGVPTWVLLPTGPGLSWFWFLDRDRSLWYPNMRLFRQRRVEDWAPVVRRIAEELPAWRDAFSRRRRTAS